MREPLMLLSDALIRSSVLLLAGLAVLFVLRGRSSALRHWILAATMTAAALAAPIAWALPDWSITRVSTPAVLVFDSPSVPASGPDVAAAVAPPASPRSSPAEPPRPSPFETMPLGMIWMFGVAAGFGSLLIQLLRLARVSSRASPITDERWLRIVGEVAERYGIRKPIAVLQTDSVDLLATWGLFRPRMLAPARATQWTEERIRVVVCHELAHVRRRDWAVQMAVDVMRRIYWFQPLMWIACRQLRRESEHACDDVVLGTGVAPDAYAGHLLQIARTVRADYGWAPAVPMARRSTLERRIAAMLNSARNRRALSSRSLVACTLILAAATFTAAAFHAEQDRSARLGGTIYDGSGAVLPGVEVTLTGGDGATANATTDASGKFQFPATAGAKYVLEAKLPGFNAFRQEFELKNAGDWDRAITLQVGKLTESVHVSAKREPATQATPGAPKPTPVRVGGNIKAPMKLVNVNPIYPASMRAAGRSGVVPLDALIATDGSVVFARVVSASVHPDFADAAVEAVRQWKFSPTLLNGKPVEVLMSVTINFSLEE
jgi:TonB family protein